MTAKTGSERQAEYRNNWKRKYGRRLDVLKSSDQLIVDGLHDDELDSYYLAPTK